MNLKNLNSKAILVIILILGAFLRFYKLDWGEGLFAHPDEYHIATSVSQLSFPTQIHPHFFSYGTVVIYLIYFTQTFLDTLTSHFSLLTFHLNPFIIGRFYSALFSTLTIIIVYNISSLFFGKKWALVGALLTALTPGLIQQAHFATPESILIFFLFSCLFFLSRFIRDGKVSDIFLSSISLGFSLGVKVIGLLFTPLLALGIFLKFFKKPKKLLLVLPLSFLCTLIVFYLVTPYVFLDYPAWRGSTEYEGSLALGKLPVFYTRQFIDTYPFLFQAEKILPYALGPVVEVTGILGVMLLAISLIKKPRSQFFLLLSSFLVLFVSNSLLFAKWTRFIALTFPFFPIFSVYFLQQVGQKSKKGSQILTATLLFLTSLWSLAFFSIYLNHDVRIEASRWLEENTSPGVSFLVEGGNMVDLPLSGKYKKLSLDFYNMETDPLVRQKIIDALETSDYFLIQSRRVFINHQRLPNLYPKTAHFYDALFNRQLGFEEIKEFHSFPSLSFSDFKIEFPDEKAEETWSVFDHPVIRVFQKKVTLTKEAYEKILEQI